MMQSHVINFSDDAVKYTQCLKWRTYFHKKVILLVELVQQESYFYVLFVDHYI